MPSETTEPFSLLLPVYAGDEASFLRRAFASAVDEQTLRPDEVVIVRDGPVGAALADELVAIRTRSPVPVRLIELAANRGLAEALTAGLAACAHEVVARMDADDIAVPERFEKQLAVLADGFDVVGSALAEFVDDEEQLLGVRTPPLEHDRIVAYSRFHDPFNHPTIVYRRGAVAAAGGYRDIGLMEDYYLFARMIALGARTANLPEPLVKYRVGAGAYARRGGYRQLRAELALQRRFRATGFTSPAQCARNLVVRGGYRLLPEAVRRGAYRTIIARGFRAGRGAA